MITSYPDKNQVKWITSRPWFKGIHYKVNVVLQSLVPNTHIVGMPFEHMDLNNLCEKGRVFNNTVICNPMETSGCHDNCEILLKQGFIDVICVGYALSSDGLWRFHSWGKKGNVIIETTTNRIMYFGCECI
jgi:hypothetical protein